MGDIKIKKKTKIKIKEKKGWGVRTIMLKREYRARRVGE